ncbi:hypothetical protein ASPWEDRAFT_176766 [Aspergillus wentii DTO 134E9]|uniref:Uncharacterized protein n=1 Tax=Aspergillus wentii DTO 134E9 TaxID=1073089 RepID=A0A1L9R595_ASPWE|nr:uncharacterized protein ASPWEDRAFT_176766 [Aspergillus wentii DTO 134E9]KAI9923728.1 hypothetical protein MW887_008355 [Aspergillus wentii]OJJ30080.1 hypothetical protein ASPWEDRAFT_176766 [Aspergillus wentii DTO 134E9]
MAVNLSQCNTIPYRAPRQKPKGVQKARRKHATIPDFNPDNSDSPFIKSFFSLPSEIRNHVYRMLLVQPCKFDMRHNLGYCQKFTFHHPGPALTYESTKGTTCAECEVNNWLYPTGIYPKPFVSPARSKWAPPMKNEFFCDNCYWHKIRSKEEKPGPSLYTLPCLCTRRSLDIMVVNKRFYDETAWLFWSENHFAFENYQLLQGFLSGIRPEVRSWIRYITLVTDNADKDGELISWRPLRPCWELLQQCDGLTALNLDAVVLANIHAIMSVLHLKAKKVSFISLPGAAETKYEFHGAFPWQAERMRKVVRNPLADLLASTIVSQKLPKSELLRQNFAQFRESQRMNDDESDW